MSELIRASSSAINEIGRGVYKEEPSTCSIVLSRPTRPQVHFSFDEEQGPGAMEEYGFVFKRAKQYVGELSVGVIVAVKDEHKPLESIVPVFGVATENGEFEGFFIGKPHTILNKSAQDQESPHRFRPYNGGVLLIDDKYERLSELRTANRRAVS